MGDYMASLDKLIERDKMNILPGHGAEVTSPKSFLLGLKIHRKAREQAILKAIVTNDSLYIPQIVNHVYQGLDERLKLAASLSALARLEDLVAKGEIKTDAAVSLGSLYQAT